MNLQPLYEIKDRLERAAMAGTGLLAEDFRLRRAAENLKPLADASPVFGKIDAGLTRLLDAPPEERAGLLLDALAVTDAVLYTQAKTGVDGRLESLPAGAGTVCPLSYGQAKPLLDALTATGSGRLEILQAALENHPGYFADFRILPAVVDGLGDSYGEIAALNADILKKVGPAALPLLKAGFDPAGKKDMARRVEAIAAIEGPAGTPWLREVLPEAKKDVRLAVLAALGNDQDNAALLLELVRTERGKHRDAVLEALAKQDGAEVRDFWHAEVEKKPEAVRWLYPSRTDWASDLAASVLLAQLEAMHAKKDLASTADRLGLEGARRASMGKSSPAMLDCWRWIDSHLNDGEQMRGASGQLLSLSGETAYWLLDSLCLAGPGPLCGLCLELWEKHRGQARYLPHRLIAALLTRPAAEVYLEFSPYIAVEEPAPQDANLAMLLQSALLKGLGRVWRNGGEFLIDNAWPTAQPLDIRWFDPLTRAVWKTAGRASRSPYAYWENVDEYDVILVRLANPAHKSIPALLIPYLRGRLAETGLAHTYSRWLFRFGGSPKRLLGQALAEDPDSGRLGSLWNLLSAAAQALPGSEVIALMEEILASGGIFHAARPQAERIFPAAISLLEAGKPFPTWDEWLKF